METIKANHPEIISCFAMGNNQYVGIDTEGLMFPDRSRLLDAVGEAIVTAKLFADKNLHITDETAKTIIYLPVHTQFI